MNTIERALQKKKQDAVERDKNQQSNEPTTVTPEPQTTIERSESKAVVSEQVAVKAPELSSGQSIELDLDKLEEKGFVSTNARRQLINEEYRAIKRKILGNAFGALSKSLKNSNIIMVTSTNPGEGKTFTAVNLALSIALEKDKTVLLVDADVLRPNVMRTLEMENREGLMEYLLGEKSDLSEIMCKTNLENLRIIPAGKSHHLSTELLASEKMYDAVEEFANRYPDRVVIVDTPPLLGINETAILANLAGQALVVAEEGKTKLADIQKAVNQLHPEMAIGFIVNKAQKVNNDEHGYGYYYAGAN
jgi:receptor protein-tyrosine kinase